MRTLLLIKPEAVPRMGEIITAVLRNRFEVKKLKMFTFDRDQAERFYEVHRGKDFFPSLVDYITGGPVVAMELEGDDAVEKLRELVGSTDPGTARPGTIRYMFGTSLQRNAVHASDSTESAKKELAIVFGDS